MKKLLIFLFPLLIQMGCSNKVHEQPSNKYPFELKMKALFSDNLEMVNSLRKAEVQISSFYLPQETNPESYTHILANETTENR
ncbi:hypothetical protein PWJ63_19325, partial [Acinetobacter nosocomialis]|nr:hypothetical protein [Acinetobacter nosocomialis]